MKLEKGELTIKIEHKITNRVKVMIFEFIVDDLLKHVRKEMFVFDPHFSINRSSKNGADTIVVDISGVDEAVMSYATDIGFAISDYAKNVQNDVYNKDLYLKKLNE